MILAASAVSSAHTMLKIFMYTYQNATLQLGDK
jgi:hypothetical protein